MIPLRDRNPSGIFPAVTLALIAANVIMFLYEVHLGPGLMKFLQHHALIPAEVTGSVRYHAIRYSDTVEPFFTSMFLHGGWMHLIFNMWFLWIFGDNVEDTLGAVRYIAFYFLCGLGAALTQFAIQPHSTVPMLGASGAIAGVLGAYAVLYPGARVVTLVPIVFFLQIIEVPAIVILGYWFVLQILSGSLTALTPTQGGTAFWAHVGGFAAGALLILVMRPRKVSV
jgi:membrane associated rhomboid family serine protease